MKTKSPPRCRQLSFRSGFLGWAVSLFVTANAFSQAPSSGLPSVTSGTLQLWLKADSGVVTNASGLVSQWQDQSGNANHASQTNSNFQPLWFNEGAGGWPAVQFNETGSNISYLEGAGDVGVSNAMTTFAIVNVFSAENDMNMVWLIGNPSAFGGSRSETDDQTYRTFSTWGYLYNAPFVIPTNTYRIWGDRLDTNLTTLELFDTSASGSTNFTTPAPDALTPGAGYYLGGLDPALPGATGWALNGDVAEWIVYNGYLSETDRLAVLNYLEQKYSLTPPPPQICPAEATATATVVKGSVANVTVTDGGCGYTNVPEVLFVGGGGSGAMATAVVSNGIVVGITLIAPGSGYTNAPTVDFTSTTPESPPPPPPATALPSVTSGTLQLWLRADTGVITNATGYVSAWQDQSGNTNDAYQTTSNNQPLLVNPPGLGGKAALRFNGIQDGVNGDYLQGGGTVNVPNAMTAFVVYNVFSDTNAGNVIWLVGVPGQVYGASRCDGILYQDFNFSTWAYDSTAPLAVPTNTYRICTDRVSANLSTVEIFDTATNGETNFTLAMPGNVTTPAAGYYIGGINPFLPDVSPDNFDGDIAEVILYNGYLSETDRLAVLNYLQQKYYTSTPGQPTCPNSATATATVVNGFVVGATVTDGGCGYTNTPQVAIVGGGGSGATATAVVSNGAVVSITINAAGSGYTNTPLIEIFTSITSQLGLIKAVIPTFSTLSVGLSYQLQLSSDLTAWTNYGAPFVATNASLIYPQAFSVTNWDQLYFRLLGNP